MTSQHHKEMFDKRTAQLDAITKPLRNAVWLGAILLALWVQFLGPGLTSALRELSGSNSLSEKMDIGFDKTNGRLDFIEQNIRPPVVVSWNFNRPVGQCTHDDCRVLHNLSRTAYGENCGIPTSSAFIRSGVTGEVFDFPFGQGFESQEATRQGRNFIIPLEVPDLIEAGTHQYQFVNIYPTCEWIREPIPRQSPWFDIEVVK